MTVNKQSRFNDANSYSYAASKLQSRSLNSRRRRLYIAILFFVVCAMLAIIVFVPSFAQNKLSEDGSYSNDTWSVRNYPRHVLSGYENFSLNFIKTYYFGTTDIDQAKKPRELNSTRSHLIWKNKDMTDNETIKQQYFPIDPKTNTPFLQVRYQDDVTARMGGTKFSDADIPKSCGPRDIVLIDAAHMPKSKDGKSCIIKNGSPLVLENEKDQAHGIGNLYFINAGEVDWGNNQKDIVDMALQFNKVTLSASGGVDRQYGKDTTNINNLEFPIATIRTNTIREFMLANSGKGNMPPEISGSISFTSDNNILSGHGINVEIEYSIGICKHVESYKDTPIPYVYPVYTSYTDLDVYRKNNEDYRESVTAIDNFYPYAYRFSDRKNSKGEIIEPSTNDQAIVETDGLVRSGKPTFADSMRDQSTSALDAWEKTGVVLASKPSEQGYYRAVWRGRTCETGVSLALCPTYTSTKSVKDDVAEFDASYTFDIDFQMPSYGVDGFYLYDSLSLQDYLPKGLSIPTKEGTSQVQDGYVKFLKQNPTTQKWEDLTQASNTVKSITIDNNNLVKCELQEGANSFLATPGNYAGEKIRMELYPIIKSYDSGSVTQYQGTHPEYKDASMWQFTNKGSVSAEGFEFSTGEVKVWTPLYGKTHTFYQIDQSGNKTTDPVPDVVNEMAKPADVEQVYKIDANKAIHPGKDIEGGSFPYLDTLKVEDALHDGYWVFCSWDGETGASKEVTQYVTKETTIAKGVDKLNFIGYWRFVKNPVEDKIYNIDKFNPDSVNDGSPVKCGQNIEYTIVGTNTDPDIKEKTAMHFTDIPSVGLTFDPSSVKIEKFYNGIITTLENPNQYLTNNLNNNRGDGSSTLLWKIPDCEYSAKYLISFTMQVNEEALVKVPHMAKNQYNLKIDNYSSKTYEVSNIVVDKQYDTSESGDGIVTDGSPVKVGDVIKYKTAWACSTDASETNQSVVVRDVMTKGLKVQNITFSEGSPIPQQEISPNPATGAEETTITWTFSNLKPGQSGVIYYEGLVTNDAEDDHRVENTAYLKVNNKDEVELNKLPNELILKKYFKGSAGGNITDSSPVKIGDSIQYYLTWASYADKDTTIEITDTVSKGLSFNPDTIDFSGLGPDEARVDYSISIDPVTKVSKLNLRILKNDSDELYPIPKGRNGQLIYTATVNEDAAAVQSVKNEYELIVNSFHKIKPKPLDNTVVNKIYDKDQATEQIIADDSPVKIGDEIAYKISWANKYDKKSAITMHDTLAEGLRFELESVKTTGLPADATLDTNVTKDEQGKTNITWCVLDSDGNVYELNPASYGTVTYRAKVTDAALKTHMVNNQYKLDVDGSPCVEIAPLENPVVDKDYNKDSAEAGIITDSSPVHVGDKLSYKIYFAGKQASDASVAVYDTLSTGLLIDKDSIKTTMTSNPKEITPPNPAITPEPPTAKGETSIVWDFGLMPANTSGYITYNATVTEDAVSVVPGLVSNKYEITVGEHSYRFIKSLENYTVDKQYNKNDTTAQVIKDDRPVVVGDTIAYKIAWSTYDHYEKATDKYQVVACDTLSKGLVIDLSSIEYSDGTPAYEFSCNPSPATGEGETTLTWTFKDAPEGASGYITYRAKVTSPYVSGGDKVNNHYKMELAKTESESSNFVVDVAALYNPVVEKSYNKTAAAEGVTTSGVPTQVGYKIAYKLFWANQDTEESSVVVTDKLSKGLFVDTSSFAYEGPQPQTVTPSGTPDQGMTTVFDFGALPAGSSGVITYMVDVTNDTQPLDYVNNDYWIQVGSLADREVNKLYNLVVSKEYDTQDTEARITDNSPVRIGDTIAYKISFGSDYNASSEVKVNDTLSKGLLIDLASIKIDCEAATPSFTVDPDPATSEGPTKLTWDFGTLPKATQGTITYRAKATDCAEPFAKVNNHYVLSVNNNPVVDVAPLENPFVPDPVKEYNGKDNSGAVKTDTAVRVGDRIAYRLTWANYKNEECQIVVTDTLSKGLDFVDESCEGVDVQPTKQWDQVNHTTKLVWEFNAKPGQGGYITYQAKVNDEASVIDGVNNDYCIKVGNDPETKVNSLHNSVTEDPSNNNNGSAQTGDNTWMMIFAVIVGLILTLSCTALYLRKKNKFVNARNCS